MTDFYSDNQVGKIGEAAVAAALKSKGHTVEDVSNIYEWQRKDVDFILRRNSSSTTLEVKNDVKSNTTGNVYVETWCEENKSRDGDGWYHYCEAEYIAFVQMKRGSAHIVQFQELIHLIDTHNYKTSKKWDGSSEGILVPLADIKQCSTYYYLPLDTYYDF